MAETDAELVARVRGGEREAFESLVARYRDMVYGLGYHLTGEFEAARDLAQETFVQAYLKLGQLRDPERFPAWLHRIATNLHRNQLRRGAVPTVPLAEEQTGRAEEHWPADIELAVREALARLRPPERLALTLHYIDGYSQAEIGGFLGVRPGTVKMRLARAREHLKQEVIAMVDETFEKRKLPEEFTAETMQRLLTAAREGRIVHRRTTMEEVKALLGPPTQEVSTRDGLQERTRLTYPGVDALFARDWGQTTSPIVFHVTAEGQKVEIGQGRLLVLRDHQELERLDSFWGVEGMSLAGLDLRNDAELLARLPFNTATVWPAPSQLPPGFDPQALLEQGKNPGLGVRGLHEKGLDGRGVGLAIIDQPLVVDHREYADRITKQDEPGVEGLPPQMHGPGVASLAVGKTCGVAPGAALHYYAMPMWSWKSCEPYRELIERILAGNRGTTGPQRVRAVSISMGMFPQWEGYDEWRKTLAEAAAQGVLVVTCEGVISDGDRLQYGTLQRREEADPDDPAGYVRGLWGLQDVLCVPAGNRTVAGHEGPEAYTYHRNGGMSWATPYLAGLTALAFQADPELDPALIVRLWQETATKTEVGPVVNPPAFLAAIQAA